MRANEINKLKQAYDTGQPMLRSISYSCCPAIVESMGCAGADIVSVDMEHPAVNWETLENLVRAIDCTGKVPMVRVCKQYPGYPSDIRKAMEIGFGVVMIPHINTKQEAEAVVRAAKFSADVKYGEPPADQLRGWSNQTRSSKYGMIPATKLASLSDMSAVIAILIEEERGVKNVEAILSVSGLDMAALAVGDYSNSIGLPGQTSHPRVREAEKRVDEVAKKKGLILRTGLNWRDVMSNPEKAKEKIKKAIKEGYTVFSIASDLAIIRDVVQQCKMVLDEAWTEVKTNS